MTSVTAVYEQTHLDRLVSESVHIFRDFAATAERPALTVAAVRG